MEVALSTHRRTPFEDVFQTSLIESILDNIVTQIQDEILTLNFLERDEIIKRIETKIRNREIEAKETAIASEIHSFLNERFNVDV